MGPSLSLSQPSGGFIDSMINIFAGMWNNETLQPLSDVTNFRPSATINP